MANKGIIILIAFILIIAIGGLVFYLVNDSDNTDNIEQTDPLETEDTEDNQNEIYQIQIDNALVDPTTPGDSVDTGSEPNVVNQNEGDPGNILFQNEGDILSQNEMSKMCIDHGLSQNECNFSQMIKIKSNCKELEIPENKCASDLINNIKKYCTDHNISDTDCNYQGYLDKYQTLQPELPKTQTDTCLYYNLSAEECTLENIDKIRSKCQELGIPDDRCKNDTINKVTGFCNLFDISDNDCNYQGYIDKYNLLTTNQEISSLQSDTCLNYQILPDNCNNENINKIKEDCKNLSIPNKKCNTDIVGRIQNYCEIFNLPSTECNFKAFNQANKNKINQDKCTELGIPSHLCNNKQIKNTVKYCEDNELTDTDCNYNKMTETQIDNIVTAMGTEPVNRIRKCIELGLPVDETNCTTSNIKNLLRSCANFPVDINKCNNKFLENINKLCSNKGLSQSCNESVLLKNHPKQYKRIYKKYY